MSGQHSVIAMRRRLISVATAVALLVATGPMLADDLAGFNAAIEDVASHSRAALGYLHNRNGDLAAVELERMRDAWGTFAERFGRDRPERFRANARYVTMLVDVPTRIVAAAIMINFGRPDAGDPPGAFRGASRQRRRAAGRLRARRQRRDGIPPGLSGRAARLGQAGGRNRFCAESRRLWGGRHALRRHGARPEPERRIPPPRRRRRRGARLRPEGHRGARRRPDPSCHHRAAVVRQPAGTALRLIAPTA